MKDRLMNGPTRLRLALNLLQVMLSVMTYPAIRRGRGLPSRLPVAAGGYREPAVAFAVGTAAGLQSTSSLRRAFPLEAEVGKEAFFLTH